ncbi:MAG: hypothetical protein ACRCZ9_03370 [Fusobacteriaceae bacterium]
MENKLAILENAEKTITSLELVKQINVFRRDVEGKAGLHHKTLLEVIRDEFEEEIDEQKILPNYYKDTLNRNQPMFELTIDQAKQVLVRESKTVRRAVIKQLEEYKNQKAVLSETEQIEKDRNTAILKIINDDGKMTFDERTLLLKVIEECDKKRFVIKSKEEILLGEIPKAIKSVASSDCYDEEYVATADWNTFDLRECLCEMKLLSKVSYRVYEINIEFEKFFIKTVMGNFKKDRTNGVFVPVFYRSSLDYFKSREFIYMLNEFLKSKDFVIESGMTKAEDKWD